jgi:hypothetical protein
MALDSVFEPNRFSLNQSERFSTSQVVGGSAMLPNDCLLYSFCIFVISSYFVVGFVKNTKNSEYFCHYVISSDFVCRSDLVVGLVTIIIKLQKNRGRCQQKM